jgi:23S rRNA pseudouridine2457 synthase
VSKKLTNSIVLLHKPFNTLCQFTGEPNDSTLSDFVPIKAVYPAGRLDKDSEGLLILTSDGKLQHAISHPKFKKTKTYWVQVEGDISEQACQQLTDGVMLKEGKTRPAKVRRLTETEVASIWPRTPPIRYRKNDVTSWLALTITEGKNRQVRRMTAAVGFPTLRLIRMQIGQWQLGALKPGEYQVVELD